MKRVSITSKRETEKNQIKGNVINNNDNIFTEFNVCKDPIILITQFHIPEEKKRREEIQFVLKKNVDEAYIDKIYLLNERIYTDEEMGVTSDKIIQTDIGARLTYKKVFEFVSELKTKAYIVLSNNDIFFDGSLINLRRSQLSEKKQLQALLRWEYKNKKQININLVVWSQDTWIIHSNFFPIL